MSEKNFKLLCDSMGKYAQSEFPFEACGIITQDFNFIPVKNISNKPRNSFMLDPTIFIEYEDNIWGIFHSHTEERFSTPSESDFKQSFWNDLKYVLFANGSFYIYWFDTTNNIKRVEPFNEHHCKN